MRKWKLLVFMFVWSSVALAQQQITLQQCFDYAIINHPVFSQKSLKADMVNVEIENYKKDLYPQIALNAKASYQNEVIGLNIDIPQLDIPELSKDQYRLSLDVQQAIYRGGLYQKQKELANLNQVLEQLDVDKNLYHIKKDVKDLFFAILLIDEQKEILKSLGNRLSSKADELKALMEEGVVLSSSLDGIKAEQLTLDIQMNELSIQRKVLMDNLQLLTHMDLSEVKELVVSPVYLEEQEQKRLEIAYLTAFQTKLEYSKDLIDVQKLPQISAFATGGYGRPGFNYLSDDFDDFYMVGLQLHWKILNWNKLNNKKKILDINIAVIESQKEELQLNIQMALAAMKAEIQKKEDILKNDPEMIRLRKSIAENASNQLNLGSITTSAYIDELQKQSQAEINMKIHRIQLINSKLDYLNALGKL